MARVVIVTPLVIIVDNYYKVVQVELGCIVGIDHQQLNEDCAVEAFANGSMYVLVPQTLELLHVPLILTKWMEDHQM